MSDGKTIPLKYKVEEGVDKASTISIKCTNVDNKENKEECVTFGNGSPPELLIQVIETIVTLSDRYEWCVEANNKAKLLFQHFRHALKGEPLRRWNKLTKST